MAVNWVIRLTAASAGCCNGPSCRSGLVLVGADVSLAATGTHKGMTATVLYSQLGDFCQLGDNFYAVSSSIILV